ncbi:MAG: M36 family metallopeptidase [Solirubrobacteraceae bacterium]
MKLLRTSSVARSATVLAVAGTTLAAPAYGADPERTAFDARPADAAEAVPGKATRALKRALGDQGLLSADPHSGTVRAAAKLDGALTAPSRRDGEAVALDYVRAHSRALGLDEGAPDSLHRTSRAVDGRMQVITWGQRHTGIPSADTYLKAAIDDRGRLLSLTGAPADDLTPPTTEPALTAAAAIAAVTGRRPGGRGARAAGDPERATTFRDGARASLVLYQADGGTRLAWRVLARAGEADLADALVDAADGTVVKRANRVKFASAKAFRSNPDDTPTQVDVDLGQWGTEATRLKGTRVHAFPDPNGVVGVELAPEPEFETSGWTEPLLRPDDCGSIVRCTWTADHKLDNQDQSTTQLYYLVNTFLDHLAAAPIGFGDASGGYGAGDRIFAQSMDSALKPASPATRNNASFLTYPDGAPGYLEVFLFSADGVRLDGANDASLVFHEVTHGLTERLVTDAQGYGALNIGQAAALAEGTSDFYAMDYLVSEELETDTPYRFAEYLGNWLRDTPIDGTTLTYADLAGGEPHTDGEIWAQTLWSLRTELGVGATRAVLTAALRIAPPEPSFLDMRNALLIASQDEATDRAIWAVFAARGMGYFAGSDGPADTSPQVSDVDPYEPPDGVAQGTLRGVVRDEDQKPVAGATVTIGGHGSSDLGAFLSTTTAANGGYALSSLQGVHPVVTASKAAFEDGVANNVEILPEDEGGGMQDFHLTRDWSSSAGGARIAAFTGPDNTGNGCGPGGLIDDRRDVVWGSATGGQSIVVDLGAPVDVASVRIDPAAGCGDDDTAALGTADVLAATSPDAFTPLTSPLTFAPADNRTLKSVFNGTRNSVRFIKLVAKTPQSTVGDGAAFVDVAELQVRKKPGTAVGPTADTGAASGVGAAGATLSGTVKANGGAAPVVVFDYGTTTAYGSIVAASGTTNVAAALTGLTGSTRYHYRVVALRDGRRYEGGDRTFVTARAPDPPPPPPPPPPVVTAKISSAKVKATRKGSFSIRVRFPSDAPEGMARVTVKSGKKTLARGERAVAPGETRSVRLKLTKTGRKVIKAGRKARKVNVTVRLPGGETFDKTIRLSRRR